MRWTAKVLIELVKTFQVPGSKSVLQLCLVIKTNGKNPEKSHAQAPAFSVRMGSYRAWFQGPEKFGGQKGFGGLLHHSALTRHLSVSHAQPQPAKTFCESYHVVQYYFDAIGKCVVSRQSCGSWRGVVEPGVGRRASPAPGASWSWEFSLSSEENSGSWISYPPGVCQMVRKTRKKVLFQRMKVDNEGEKVALWSILFWMELLVT